MLAVLTILLTILSRHTVICLVNTLDTNDTMAKCDWSSLLRLTRTMSNVSSSPALLSTSSDRMYSHQYLRVTLKSILPINRFILRAVTDNDTAGGLGTWFLPFGDTQSPNSRYLNCSGGVHNAVTNSDAISGVDYVIFFQWMPDKGFEGDVVFTGLVMRAYRDFWETVTGIKVCR